MEILKFSNYLNWVRAGSLLVWVLILFALPSFGQVKFKDVPADHWAAKSVYDLVKLGVTQGYPDGTFRGKKNITRFETAIFLSKLSEKLGGTDMVQLKKDISDIKDELNSKQSNLNTPISGEFEMNTKTANLLASSGNVTGRGPIMNYRLKTSLSQNLKQGNSLKINFDTMDSGFMGATRELTSQMIDITGIFKINPVDLGLYDFGAPLDLTLTMGPGPIQHTDVSGILPSENGYVYERPYSGIDLSTQLFGVNSSVAYFQIAKNSSGLSTTSLVKGAVKYDFLNVGRIEKIDLGMEGDYYIKHPTTAGTRDLRAKVNVDAVLSPKITLKTKIGFGSLDSHGIMASAEFWFFDPWNTNTTIRLGGSKIGGDYITSNFQQDEFNLAGYDLYMRPLQNGTVNINAEVIQTISEKLTFSGKSSIRLAGDFGYGKDKEKSRATSQLGLSYEVVKSALLNIYYRVEQDPTIQETTDLVALVLSYKF